MTWSVAAVGWNLNNVIVFAVVEKDLMVLYVGEGHLSWENAYVKEQSVKHVISCYWAIEPDGQ